MEMCSFWIKSQNIRYVDSDFNFVTNQPEMVKAAKKAYEEYPTVVNSILESKTQYDNTLEEYARMDISMQNAQKQIGGSSDSAQLANSYYFDRLTKGIIDDDTKLLYDDINILAVCAQLSIDGCKKIFDINVEDEIKRIRSQDVMKREKDYPRFMKYTHKIPTTKNGKDRAYEDVQSDKRKINKRVDDNIECPMNWAIDCLDRIQGGSSLATQDTLIFLIEKPKKVPTNNQMNKIRSIVEDYDSFVKYYITMANMDDEEEDFSMLKNKTEEVIESVKQMSISIPTMYRLIQTSLKTDWPGKKDKWYEKASKYTTRMLNVLYRAEREKFLSCFKKLD